MGSAWIQKRKRKKGWSYRVLYRLGGRDFPVLYAAAFGTPREATQFLVRLRDEIAKGIDVFDIAPLVGKVKRERSPVLPEAVIQFLAGHISVVDSTLEMHRRSLDRIYKVKPEWRSRRVDEIKDTDVVELVHALMEAGYKRGSISKTRDALSLVFQHYDIEPDPARSRKVKLPTEEREDQPVPIGSHVERVAEDMTVHHVIPFLILDCCGPRVSVLMKVKLGDLDPQLRAIRVPAKVQKNKKWAYLRLTDDLWEALQQVLPPPEDRNPDDPLFPGITDAQIRKAIKDACQRTGVSHFSPHGLRRRRGCLVYKQTGSLAEAAATLNDSVRVAAQHYIYALTDYNEADYTIALARALAPDLVAA
jgi:integrase